MVSELTIADLARPLPAVARGLPQWERGDIDEAIGATLDLSARNTHARAYVAWVWSTRDPRGTPTWLLPVTVQDAERFAPSGPMAVALRCIRAAAAAGARPSGIQLFDWDGFVALCAPGLDDELGQIALDEAHAAPASTTVAHAPTVVDGPALDLAPLRRDQRADGITLLGLLTRTHPLSFAPTLLDHGWTLEEEHFPDEVADILRHSGFEGPEVHPDAPSLAIEDDPCPRRRFARRLLRRLLHKRKIGDQYHTAFDHIAHGVAPDDRADAYAIGEALIREGLLGEKPSSGQRHVFLRRDALPRIHALIERAVSDPRLAGEWRCDPPGL